MDSARALRRIGVIGGGMLGASIAHLSVEAGLECVVKARGNRESVERCRSALGRSLEREVRDGRATTVEFEANLARLQVSSEYEALGGCELVVECVPEKFELKRQVLREAESHLDPRSALASSTSALSLSRLCADLDHPERFLGMHYFWPAHRRRLVEIAPHAGTTPSILDLAYAAAGAQNAQVLAVVDSPGFLTSRIIIAYFSEAIQLARQGVSFEEVDRALEGFGWPMGAFRLMDLLSMQTLAEAYDTMKPVLGARGDGLEVLWRLIRVGHGGRRAGSGFYLYEGDRKVPNPEALAMFAPGNGSRPPSEEWALRPTHMLIHEAAHCLAEGVVASWRDVDLGATEGLAFPTNHGGGMLGYLRTIGWDGFLRRLADWESRYGARFQPRWRGAIPEPFVGVVERG